MKLLSLVLITVALAASPLAAQTDSGSSDTQSKGDTHIFGVLPNFATVEGDNGGAPPVTSTQKFQMATKNTFDPFVYPLVGVIAVTQRSYGSGTGGYMKQYTASLTDNLNGNFLTTAILPSMLHQDPRYFQNGHGSVLHRIAYSASRSAITRGDSGHRQLNASELGGTAIAAGISNLYYPDEKRNATDTLTRWGMQVMWDTLSNELKEFWPDVRQMMHRQ